MAHFLRRSTLKRWRRRAAPFVGALLLGAVLGAGLGLSLPKDAPAAPSGRLRAIDGDTVVLIEDGERIRILNIDAPESGDRARCDAERAAARRATQALRDVLRSGAASILRSGETDRYGRTLARISVNGIDVSSTLLAQGVVRPWRGRREPWCGPHGELLP